MRTSAASRRSTSPTLPTNRPRLIDDRLLVDLVLAAEPPGWIRGGALFTTQYWYYRAARAAVAGGSGQLSGPFAQLPIDEQARAIEALLTLPDDIGLPEVRALVPEMVEVSRRHQRLNLLNVEAVAAAAVLDAAVLLAPRTADGVLPDVLDTESIEWSVTEPG